MKKTTTILVFALLSAFGSCTFCSHEELAPSTNIIVLVDLSKSRDTTILCWYKEIIKHSILENMGTKDHLVMLPIDFNSETSSEELFKVNFAKNDYSSEFGGLQKDEQEHENHMDSVHAAELRFEPVFQTALQKREGSRGGTDIFGAIAQSAKYVVPDCKNVLVIMSDMLQYTDKATWNFEEHLNDTGEIQHYLSMAQKIDLQNVQVIVLCGAQNNMQPNKFATIRLFWEQYFQKKCTTHLIDYSSGAVTKLEELLAK